MFNITQGDTFLHHMRNIRVPDDEGNPIDLTAWEVESWVFFEKSQTTKAINATLTGDTEAGFTVELRQNDTTKWPIHEEGDVRLRIKLPESQGGVTKTTPEGQMPVMVSAPMRNVT